MTNKVLKTALTSAFLVMFFGGCVRHIYPYKPRKRIVEATPIKPEKPLRTEGSLWAQNGGLLLFEDMRAQKEGDIVQIKIDEFSQASRDASTQAGSKSSISANANDFMGFLKALQKSNPNFDRASLLSAGTANDFQGSGKTARNSKLLATVPGKVMKIMPDGSLFIEGSRVILLNNEEHHLYISGFIRPSDVEADNSIKSSLIADAQVEFVGRGVLSEKMNPGWLSRIMSWIWPF